MTKPFILYVDDDEDDIDFMKHFFSHHLNAPHIEHVTSGRKALDFLAQQKQLSYLPRLILIDYNMPNLNGVELIRQIRQDKDLNHIKLAIISTSSNERYEEEAQGLHIPYFQKPSKQSDFHLLVAKLITYCEAL